MKVHICRIVDDVSCRESIGVGLSQHSATEDALLHFPDLTKRRTAKMIEKRAAFYYEVRPLR